MSQYDEESISRRPTRGNTRRRTKDRPDFSGATIGQVIGVDRGRITCVVPAGALHEDQVEVTTVKARELGRKGVVIGDRVRLVGDLSGTFDTLARLVEIINRETVLTRTADDSDPIERVIVANADQMAIVTATANPEPRFGLIDRSLVPKKNDLVLVVIDGEFKVIRFPRAFLETEFILWGLISYIIHYAR